VILTQGILVSDKELSVFYFLVFGTCLALVALFFSCLAVSAFTCFCTACLCVAFGDLSPMTRRVRSMRTSVNRRLVCFCCGNCYPDIRRFNFHGSSVIRDTLEKVVNTFRSCR